MNVIEKARILGASSKWDRCNAVSLSRKSEFRRARFPGIYYSDKSGCVVPIFKVLMSNACSFDCKYCQNSACCNKPKAAFTPEELAELFYRLYKNRLVEGLFLSSAVTCDADLAEERMLEAVRLIREKYRFQGYIHLKILPGVSRELLKEACLLADRVSINIEAPSASRLAELSSTKDYKIDLLRRQRWLAKQNLRFGHTTQFVVGAANESDAEILRMLCWQYKKVGLKRAYFSAFKPLKGTPLEHKEETPDERERRLYMADYLLRKYGFPLKEFEQIMVDGNLPKGDPKIHLAMHYFDAPLDINDASYDELLHVPGIGPKSARRIIELREEGKRIRDVKELAALGVVVRRARPFIKIGNSMQSRIGDYL